MRFLVDAQLPPGLARRLSEMGHDAVHLHEVMAWEAKDIEVAERANSQGAVLVTKDEDFIDLSHRGVLVVPVLWIRLGNTTNTVLWRKLEPLLSGIEAAFAAGERIVEVR